MLNLSVTVPVNRFGRTPEEVKERRREKQRKYALAWRSRNPEKAKARAKAWREQNPEKDKAFKKASKLKHCEKIKVARKRRVLAKWYGITLEGFGSMLASQGGACACCGALDPGRSGDFHVDHDHDTGEVRGLLCNRCNLGIGMLGDSLAGIEKAHRYLMTGRGKC
jgi:ferric-dicitrate binding protein FerR (iron transport regulator)